ncbi:MAG TPA: polysaccharide deacetylase family protein [Solirubrobacterales bacterium]|nr:polysaccharide deacetylase family protein [Solirubrobacterales bacterium]
MKNPTRKILCAAALAVSAIGTATPSAPAAELHQLDHPADGQVDAVRTREAGPRMLRARLAQKGRELIFSVRASEAVGLGELEPHPDPRRADARYLCFELASDPSASSLRFCLGGPKAHRRIGIEQVNPAGRPTQESWVRATVKRPRPEKLVVAIVPGEAALSPQRYRWRAIRSSGCEVRNRCAESLPATGTDTFRLRPVRAVGCTGGRPGLVTHGPRDRPLVALTFDDGPSEYTDDFLRVLREKGVHGTFFQVGQEMPGREDVMRQILAEGHELGDHTMNHVEYPGYDQIAGAAARIAAYTHFRPCLFRPPGGGVNASVVATAGSLGMRTINWDVDPRDWSLPGTGAIYSNIVSHARNGSIILMHDGGGPRGETLAALPRIIDTLRARGFGFATVSELLGYRILYRPYG